LRERREQLALTELRSSLADLLTGRALTPAEVPAWVGPTLRGFWDVHVDPAAVLPDDAPPEALDAWITSLLADNGISGTLFLRTHLPDPSWLECRAHGADWLRRVRRATGDPWRFLSAELDTLVVVTEEEYVFHAHVGRRS
jgi:hypothetical protein